MPFLQEIAHLCETDFRHTVEPPGGGKRAKGGEAEPHRLIHNFPCIDLFPVFSGDVKKTLQHAVEKHLPLARILYDIGSAASADPTNDIDCEFKSGTKGKVNEGWNDLETSTLEAKQLFFKITSEPSVNFRRRIESPPRLKPPGFRGFKCQALISVSP